MSGTGDILSELSTWLESRLADLHTALPARVVSFDPDGPTASVQPLARRTYVLVGGDRKVVDLPQIERAPVWYPRGGGWSMTWPLAPGDLVLLVVAERSLDRWLASHDGAAYSPGDPRKHDLSDGIVFAGFAPRAVGPTVDAEDLVIGQDSEAANHSELRLKPTGEVFLSAGGEADQAMVRGDELVAWLQNHTHQTAQGPSAPPTEPIPATVRSAKAKLR